MFLIAVYLILSFLPNGEPQEILRLFVTHGIVCPQSAVLPESGFI